MPPSPPRTRRNASAGSSSTGSKRTAGPPPSPLIRDLLASGGQAFSFEFMPPKTEAEEAQLWRAIRQLEPLRPTFVSVTYGAGGSTRDRTVRVTGRIAEETTSTSAESMFSALWPIATVMPLSRSRLTLALSATSEPVTV